MSEQKSALDYVVSWRGSIDMREQVKARAELVALRARCERAEVECVKWREWKPSNDEYIAKIEADLATITTERDAARDALKVYERQRALRQ